LKITIKHLQHMVDFLTHNANYKVGIMEDDYEHNFNTTEELLDNAKQLMDMYFNNTITYEKAMECVTHYRYDDDCINEGISEMWFDYCNEHNIMDFYNADKEAHVYVERK
jgi:hypothetical protein